MTCSEVAQRFFEAIEAEEWDRAVAFLSQEFKTSFAPHAKFRLEGMRTRYVSEAAYSIPGTTDSILAEWLRTSGYRATYDRELAQARYESPEREWQIVGGYHPPRRAVIGEVAESESKVIVVYRPYGDRGEAKTIELVRESSQWLINSGGYELETHLGLGVEPEKPRDT